MKITTIGLDTYLKNSDDWILKLVSKHENKKISYSVTKQAKEYLSEFQIQQIPGMEVLETSAEKS